MINEFFPINIHSNVQSLVYNHEFKDGQEQLSTIFYMFRIISPLGYMMNT